VSISAHADAAASSASARNIRAIRDLEQLALTSRSIGERWADGVARTAGKVWFAVLHFFWFAGWILLNSGVFPVSPFDPFPFALLTLATSLEAIFLSLFILTSQNRANAQADQRAHLDLQINLLAESESTVTLKMLRALCAHHGLEIAHDPEIEQLTHRTEPKALVKDIETELPDAR
jgi:uncharacterized membrane protein